MNKNSILVVEDDRPIRNLIITALKTHDYKYLEAENGTSAILEASSHNPDIVLLDLGLPDIEGVEVIKKIRMWSNMPIIVISARNEDTDKIEALDAGADDYITKPFSLMVLRARVSVQLRNKEMASKDFMEFDGFEFYFDRMEFFKDREPIELSKTEQKLLRVLCENKGKVLKREYLIDEVWQGDTEFVDAHALTVAIKRLRDKLEDNVQKPKYIKTVYGIGYTWAVNG